MKRAPLLLAVAVALAGCAEDELERNDDAIADSVQLAERDPGPACRGIAAVEVRSGQNDAPSSATLRQYAATRGANYVVVDTFSVYDEPEPNSVLTRARLFFCPAPAAEWR